MMKHLVVCFAATIALLCSGIVMSADNTADAPTYEMQKVDRELAGVTGLPVAGEEILTSTAAAEATARNFHDYEGSHTNDSTSAPVGGAALGVGNVT